MNNLKKFIYVLMLFCSVISFSQINSKNVKFYLEIPNAINIPTVTKNANTVTLTFSNAVLTNSFKNFSISNFELAFPGGKGAILTIVYIIECDPKLIENIANNYASFFGRWEEIEPINLLYLPNDLNGSISNPILTQFELPFINAPQAWDISKGDGVQIGIAEGILESHEDIAGKFHNLTSSTTFSHGTQVSLMAAASTDNNLGMASIGFNCNIIAHGGYMSGVIPIANAGARVINMSWGSCNDLPLSAQYGQAVMDQVYNSGVVLVAAAGNGFQRCPSSRELYHYPASLNNVISVTEVGHIFEPYDTALNHGNQKDIFEMSDFLFGGVNFSTTFNDKVDLSAPGYAIITASDNLINGSYSYNGGSSFAAPMVTGTIGLMFGANPCLFPNEVETILKLTAFKNDTLPLNLAYQGKLGAGRLDAYLAVDMAKDMALPTGTVEVKNRIIDRWDFNLRTAPYKIEMTNNKVSGNATLDFTARNNIEIFYGEDYRPSGSGFIDLKIKTINDVCNTPITIPVATQSIVNSSNNVSKNNIINLYPNPNNGTFALVVNSKNVQDLKIEIFDLFGILIYTAITNSTKNEINIENAPKGFYVIKLTSSAINENIKFVKE